MTKELFLTLMNKTLYNFPNYPEGTYEELRYMKSYIYSHLDFEEVKKIKLELALKYKEALLNSGLEDAFEEKYDYMKKIKVISRFLERPYLNYRTYLFNLFNFKSYNFYEMCKELFEETGILDEQLGRIINNCVEFINNNSTLYKGGYSTYYSLDDEIALSKKIQRNLIQDDGTDKTSIKKRIGNIGEYYYFAYITEFEYACFVARDVKDGFGFDLYYLENNTENLIEVKTTLQDLSSAYIELTENEYKVMKETLNNPNCNSIYKIIRIKLDSDFSLSDKEILVTHDGIVFTCTNKPDVEYYMAPNNEGKILIAPSKQKQKTL